MLKVQVSVPELKARAAAIREMAADPMTTLQTLAGDLRGKFEAWMNELMVAELSLHLGRERYERKKSSNHRNGFRSRAITVKGLGTLELCIPRDRDGSFRSGAVPEHLQYDPRIEQDLQMLVLDRKVIAHEMRKVFYAADRLGAKCALESFSGKWKAIYPDAVRCLEKDFDPIVAYMEFPEEEWMHLRTTNLIERLNKEFKRRTKPMEIVVGEASVYTLLAFGAMKMEVSWRHARFRNSGFRKLKPFAGYFTHESRQTRPGKGALITAVSVSAGPFSRAA